MRETANFLTSSVYVARSATSRKLLTLAGLSRQRDDRAVKWTKGEARGRNFEFLLSEDSHQAVRILAPSRNLWISRMASTLLARPEFIRGGGIIFTRIRKRGNRVPARINAPSVWISFTALET